MIEIVHKLTVGALGAAVLLAPAPAFAQAASANSGFRSEYRLTEQEKEEIIAAAEAKTRISEAKQEVIDLREPLAIGGEAGFSIGTDGSRSAFGSAFYPLHGAGGAAISLDFGRLGDFARPLIIGTPNR